MMYTFPGFVSAISKHGIMSSNIQKDKISPIRFGAIQQCFIFTETNWGKVY